jgi:gamma-glutamylcyclotransferase (GGCT)/AIG2-like uncharacterized protein YtfP
MTTGLRNGGTAAPSESPDTRLATYGTLSPGRTNHHQLAGLRGKWREGTVRSTLVEIGWGAALGYPGLIPDPDGPPVGVALFDSPDLPAHWERLDVFEGEGYRRVVVTVSTANGETDAWIYAVAPEAGCDG